MSTRKLSRTRGAASGLLLLLLGAWGALIPFIGPSFNYLYTPDASWKWTAARGWYEVLPGSVTFVGGLLLLFGTSRAMTVLGAWLAIAAGAWFIIGPAISTEISLGSIGQPKGDNAGLRVAEILGFFYGLGAIILFLAASAFGRLSVVTVRDVKIAERREAARMEAEEEARRVDADNAAYRDAGRSRFFDEDEENNRTENRDNQQGYSGYSSGYQRSENVGAGETPQQPQQYGNTDTRQMPPVGSTGAGSDPRTGESQQGPRPTTSSYHSAVGQQDGEQEGGYSSPTYGRHDANYGRGNDGPTT
ncbi:MAG TPA: hypothetical protein VGH43_01675 [Jatrophihabitans sp.]